MKIFGRIEKIDPLDDGTVRVHGIASTEATDDQGEVVRAAAMRAAIPEYMRFPAIREMHQLSAAGTALEVEVGDDNITRLVAHVVDPIAVSKVKTKTYRGFSIGGRVTQRDPSNNKTITGLTLSEISLVDRPANPDSVFDVWKSDMPESQTATAAPFNPPIQIWACADDTHRHIAKADALKCLEKLAAGGVAEQPESEPDPEPTEVDIEKQGADGAASAQALIDAALKAVEDGEVALAKAEPESDPIAKDNGDMGEAAKDNGDGGDMGEAAKDGDKPYGNVPYADPGHQSDGKKRYPIDTEAHIRAAWNYINKPKNAGKYDAKDLASIKSKIVSAWKSKIDKDGPPSAKTAVSDFSKSLWDIGEVAMLIAGLRAMCERLELERAMEGDDSTLPESCEAVLANACTLLTAMCAEETQEVLNDTEIDEPVGPQMSAMMMSAIAESLAKAIPDTEKVEQLMETLDKANRRHSAPHLAQLDVAAYAIEKGLEIGGLKRGEMASAGRAHKAVLDSGATVVGGGSRQMLTNSNPSPDGGATTHATTDTGRNGLTAVPNPTGASPASPFPKVSKAAGADEIEAIDAMVKAGKPAASLFTRAHDLLHDVSEGATCKDGTPKPAHLSGRDMARLIEAHDNLMSIENVACAVASAPEPAGAPDVPAVVDTLKITAGAPDVAGKAAMDWVKENTPVAAPEQVWEVVRLERDDLAKALTTERAEKAELVKTIGAIVPMLDRLTKRVDQIADTPIPGRAHTGAGVVALSKAQDYGGSGLGGDGSLGARPSFDTVLKSMPPEVLAAYDALPADDQSMLMIKHSLGQPISYDPVKRVLVTP